MDLDFSDMVDLVPQTSQRSRKLGTFGGVFAPVCLAMFSALLFSRLSLVLGNAGLIETILQMFIAYTILVFTILSVSAITTNGAVEGGGIYFMTSRVLGPELGGSIGILFFIANIVSAALYLKLCIEALMNNFGPFGVMKQILPGGEDLPLVYASIINLFNLVVCIFGAAMFARTTLVLFGIVVFVTISIIVSLSFQHPQFIEPAEGNKIPFSLQYTGFNSTTFYGNLYPKFSVDYITGKETSFSSTFGVFFTGVTGVLAGANISGDLKNPAKSIPLGTLSSIAFTFITYISIFILSSATCSRELLLNNYLYLQYINFWPPLVAIGIFFVTVSAALTNLIGASRLLNAISVDRLFGWLLDPIHKSSVKENPIGAVLMTWFLIQISLLIEGLDQITQLASILFMFTYFSLSLSCTMLILVSAPNFRPSFKYFNLLTATVGLIGSASMMFVIQPLYASAVFITILLLMIGLHLRSPPVRWGDISQALIFHQVRKYLLMLDQRKDHVKYWRPRILLMIENPKTCLPLLEFTNDLKKSGLFVIGHVEVGSLNDYEYDPVNQQYSIWLKWLDLFTVKAFMEITLAESVREGLYHISRIAGLGAMKLNTVILGLYDDNRSVDFLCNDPRYKAIQDIYGSAQDEVFCIRKSERMTPIEYVSMVSDIIKKLDKNVCLARNFYDLDLTCLNSKAKKYYIDIWPSNFFSPQSVLIIDNCAKLIMQLACILNMVPRWKSSTSIRLLICSNHRDQQLLYEMWHKMLTELRVDADLNLIINDIVLASANSNQESFSTQRNSIPSSSSSITVDQDYIKAVNTILTDRSSSTLVSLMYLPDPPTKVTEYETYLSNLQLLTEGMPPTLLIHGTDHVVSTSL